MLKASHLFNDEQRKRVKQTVVDAESHTSCEIVTVVASSSGRYDRPEDIIGFWFAGLSTIFLWILFSRNPQEAGSWDTISLSAEILTLVVSMIIMFMLGVVLGSQLGWLRRLFTPRKQMMEEVTSQASKVFFDKRVHHTTSATGLLIYISLFERIAIILGDQEILDHPQLGQSFLDKICQQLTTHLHAENYTEGICETISEAGQQLSKALPRKNDDVNELHDALVLID